jgi:hypothetical protein
MKIKHATLRAAEYRNGTVKRWQDVIGYHPETGDDWLLHEIEDALCEAIEGADDYPGKDEETDTDLWGFQAARDLACDIAHLIDGRA